MFTLRLGLREYSSSYFITLCFRLPFPLPVVVSPVIFGFCELANVLSLPGCSHFSALAAASQHKGYTGYTATGYQLSSMSISFTYSLFL